MTMKHVFANGLTLLTESQPGTGYTHIAVRVGVGSIHEPPELRGVSHFLEHMLFRGTKMHPTAEEQNEAADLLGGPIEAYTTENATVYSISVRSDCVFAALLLFRDLFETPVFSDIELERNIVQEEILESLDANGNNVDAIQLITKKLFPSDRRGLPIYGSPESVAQISEGNLREWLERHYVGSNMTCIITGELGDLEEVTAIQVADTLGRVPHGVRARAEVVQENQDSGALYVDHGGSQANVCVAWRINTPYAPRAAAFNVFADLLGGSMYKSLVQDAGLCYETGNHFFAQHDCVSFVLSAKCAPENVDAVIQALLEAPSESFSERVLRRHISTASFGLTQSLRTPTGLAAALLEQIDLQSEPLRETDIQQLTTTQIEEVRALIDPNQVSIVTVGPGPTLAQVISGVVSRLVGEVSRF